ncbi:MAG TPA: TetR/AcrR family transcriptional regulator [Ktedonobacterales bacterium]|jgi:TetR/AcrR family transcriptional regulator|nr:TetR/AcrR family transcriptional regulator [Ktedonobacterales bacterium]
MDNTRSELPPEIEAEAGDDSDGPDRRRQILDAAFEEFAEHGFRGATIKRIAQRARLKSQALIYWYFPAKEALFEAVLGQQLPIMQLVLDPAPLLDKPPEEVLSRLARAYLTTADRPGAPRLVRLLAPELIRRPEVADTVGGLLITKILAFIKTYLTHQVEMGRLRPHDVRASSRAFIGMILPQLGGKLFLPALRADGPTDDEYIVALVNIFLRGLQPTERLDR